jgi:hypothetical protein
VAGQQQQQAPGAEQLCLDKTFLLDTVVRMDLDALQVCKGGAWVF